jgi:hypothetical protein
VGALTRCRKSEKNIEVAGGLWVCVCGERGGTVRYAYKPSIKQHEGIVDKQAEHSRE